MITECLVVEFRVTGDGCPLADASRAGTIDAAPPLLREDGYALLRFSTPSSDVGSILDEDDRIRYLHRAATDGRFTFRCLSKAPCVVHELVGAGFLVESIRYTDGTEQHVGAVVGRDVLEGVLEAAGETVGVELLSISPLDEEGNSAVEGRFNLTSAQAEALSAAYEMGYFTVPREATAGDVAAEIGISKSAFGERLRRAQAAIFERVLV